MSKKKTKIYSVIKESRHPAEYPITVLAVLITLGLYALITYVLVFGSNDAAKLDKVLKMFGIQSRAIKLIINIGGPAIFLIILFLLIKLCMAATSFVGKASIKGTRLQDSNYDKVKEIYDKFSKDLQLSKPPIVYITKAEKEKDKDKKNSSNGNKPSYLGITICSNKAICISDKLINDAIESDDYSELEYELATNLGDIYLSHYDIPVIVLTFAARVLPYFHNLCERILCYSTDKFAAQLIGKEKILSILYNNNFNSSVHASDDENKNIENIIKEVNVHEKNGRAYENFMSEKPIAVYRLEAIYYDKSGKVM